MKFVTTVTIIVLWKTDNDWEWWWWWWFEFIIFFLISYSIWMNVEFRTNWKCSYCSLACLSNNIIYYSWWWYGDSIHLSTNENKVKPISFLKSEWIYSSVWLWRANLYSRLNELWQIITGHGLLSFFDRSLFFYVEPCTKRKKFNEFNEYNWISFIISIRRQSNSIVPSYSDNFELIEFFLWNLEFPLFNYIIHNDIIVDYCGFGRNTLSFRLMHVCISNKQ